MTRPTCILVTLAVMSLASLAITASDAVSLPELAGTYVSSMDGGCSFELQSEGAFSLSCLSQPIRKGQVQMVGEGFRIEGGGVFAEWGVRPRGVVVQGPPAPPGDPTRGPLVVSASEGTNALLLEPLRWGTRLYLIRNGDFDGFCRAIRAGVEPRKEAGGVAFLKRGDHTKRAGRKAPRQCVDPK